MVDWGKIVVDEDGTFEEGPMCTVDSRGIRLCEEGREASEGVVAAPRNIGGNMGT